MSGTLALALTGGGTLILRNLSPIELTIVFSNGDQELLEAWTGRRYDFNQPTTYLTWAQYIVPSGQQNSPLSAVTGIQYDPKSAKCIRETYPIAFHRLANVGNASIPTTGISTIANDGNPTGTQFIEATEAGSVGSNVSVNNDGSALFKLLSAGGYANVLQLIRGSASLKAQLILQFLAVVGAASLDSGHLTTDGAGNVTGVSFTGAVHGNADTATSATSAGTVPGSGVTGDIAVTQVGPGALDSDVTIAGSQVTGAITTAQSLANGAATLKITSGAGPTTFNDIWKATNYGAGTYTNLDIELVDNGVATDYRLMNYNGLIPVATVASGYPAASLSAGAIPAGVTLAGSQLSAGSIPAGVTLPANQLGAGYIPAGTQVSSTNNLDGSPIPVAGGKTITGFSKASISGSGTVSHSLGVTPDGVLINADAGTNSTTVGSGSYTTTSVYAYIFSAMSCIVLVYKAG